MIFIVNDEIHIFMMKLFVIDFQILKINNFYCQILNHFGKYIIYLLLLFCDK